MNQFVISTSNQNSIIQNNSDICSVDTNNVLGGRFIVQSKAERNSLTKKKACIYEVLCHRGWHRLLINK